MKQTTNQYSVLFIEDEKAIRDNYVSYLQKHFQNVYEAEDGEQAYEIYKRKRPELLIVDINIPKLNGLDLVKRIRETDRETKAIMLTAHAEVKYLLEATELNLSKYLVKPITRKELKAALSNAIEDINKFTTTTNKIVNLRENYFWNSETRELHDGDIFISLTKTELEIFSFFILNANRVATYEECIWKVWGEYSDYKTDAFKTLIKNLRKKLPPNTIENVFGVGYKLSI